MSSKNELPLRLCTGIALLNNENKVFVGKRIDQSMNLSPSIDNPEKYWQMPQGGIEKDENFYEAAKRELEEETGIKSIKLIKELNGWLEYDLPKDLLGKIWNGKYRGQKQKWFIFKFLGNNSEINIKTKNPEFLDWKWIEISKLTEVVVSFKMHVYKKIKEELINLKLN